jgi:hypothetical protein
MSPIPQRDLVGRIIGMLVFLVGVGLLLLVFNLAYHLFNSPPSDALGLTFTGNPKSDPPPMKIGAQVTWLLLRIGYLVIMSVAGSLVANKGINLYFSALQGSPVHLFGRTRPEPPVENLPAKE